MTVIVARTTRGVSKRLWSGVKEMPDRVSATAETRIATADGRLDRAARICEWLLIGALVLVYGASFRITSPVNGLGAIREVFDQDSRYIITSLASGIPYEWNPQNHLLYHWLTERVFQVWHYRFGGGTRSAYLFLKLFTAATGLWFLITLRVFLREIGLEALQRLAFLPLVGLSMAVWFHYAAFETSGLTLPLLLLFLIAFLRRVRKRDASLTNHVLLIGSMLFAFWVRSDQWRLPVAMGITLLLPKMRGLRRGLALDLGLFAVLLPIGFCLLASNYFHVPLTQSVHKLVERHDRADLAPMLMNRRNLAPRYLLRVARANALYSVIMPVADQASPFSAKTNGMLHSPLSLSALLGVAGLLLITWTRSLRRLASGDVFHAMLWLSWIVGWLFYTWFNPHEPFLWILQFGVLEIVMLADTWPATRQLLPIAGMALIATVIALHNTMFFWLPYR
jgi:hypothetical protein